LQPVQFSPLQLSGLITAGTAATSSGATIIVHGASIPTIGVGALVVVLVNGVALITALLTAQAAAGRSATRAQKFDRRLDGIDRTFADVQADTRRGLQIHREILDVLQGLAAGHDDGAPTGPHPIQLYPTN
jgi:hypothetical protein